MNNVTLLILSMMTSSTNWWLPMGEHKKIIISSSTQGMPLSSWSSSKIVDEGHQTVDFGLVVTVLAVDRRALFPFLYGLVCSLDDYFQPIPDANSQLVRTEQIGGPLGYSSHGACCL